MRIGTIYLAVFFLCLASCGGGGGGGESAGGGGGTANFVVPAGIVSTTFQDCLQTQATEKGWRSHADVREIECLPDYSVSDHGIGVETLDGVQAFTNLEKITIYSSGTLGLGRINTLAPLQNLGRLHTVEMYDSDLRSLESIRGKTSLQQLVIIPSRLGNISALPSLSNLKHLTLSGATTDAPPIADFMPLGQMSNLEELRLEAHYELKNQGLAFLTSMTNLRLLDISENFLLTADEIQSLPNLEVLDLSYNNLFLSFDDSQIEALLSGLVSLKEFWYSGFDGESLSFVQGMQNLEVLAITRYYLLSATDLNIIGSQAGLRELYLGGFASADISLLQNLTNLEVLWLAEGNIDSASLVLPATLASLREVYLLNAFRFSYDFGDSRGDFKNSYSVFSDLPNLTELHLDKPWFLDDASVVSNPGIESLSLVAARLSNIDFFQDIGGIQKLDLSKNPFFELDAVASMPDLKELTLNETVTSCPELAAFRSAAPNVIVTTDLFCP